MKKIGLLCLALVLALGTLGVGLAWWTETLTIAGSVATGERDIHFSAATTSDSDGGMVGGGNNVVVLSDSDGDGDMDTATITVTNAYPSFTCTTWLTVHNNGTIPAHLTVAIVSASPELVVSISDDPTCSTIAPCESKTFDVKIHVTVSAAENSSYSCSLRVTGKQFNAP